MSETTNDIHSDKFESKMDPQFLADYKGLYERRRIASWTEAKSAYSKKMRPKRIKHHK